MTLLRRRPRIDALTWADVEPVDEFDGIKYVQWKGDTFAVDVTPLAADVVARPLGDLEIRIREPWEKLTFGTLETGTHTYRGLRVDAGTIATLRRRKERRERFVKAPAEARPVDALARYPQLNRQTSTIIAPPASNVAGDLALEAAKSTPVGSTIDVPTGPGNHRAAIYAAIHEPWKARGVESILQAAERKGIRHVALPDGRVILLAPKGWIAADMDCYRTALPLTAPFVATGTVPDCEVTRHDPPVPAVTVAEPGGIVWCGECVP